MGETIYPEMIRKLHYERMDIVTAQRLQPLHCWNMLELLKKDHIMHKNVLKRTFEYKH